MSNIVKITKKEFIERFNPGNMLKEFRSVNSLGEAINSDKNTLAVYKKHLGEDSVLALIELHLLALNESINVDRSLTSLQIKEIAIEINTLYYYLNMVEIGFVFRKAKRGEYGKFYNSISMPEVLSWFEKYSEDRFNHHINKNLDKHSNYRDDSMRTEDRKLWEQHEAVINKLKSEPKEEK